MGVRSTIIIIIMTDKDETYNAFRTSPRLNYGISTGAKSSSNMNQRKNLSPRQDNGERRVVACEKWASEAQY